jgi:very-short-patch-repair endonuclease
MEPRHRIHPTIRQFARELRQPQTPAEVTLWQHLRNRNLKYKFRRQHPIEFFIIDFYCAEAKLLIEVDGASHFQNSQIEYDQARTEYLEGLGYKIIRFTNHDVRYNINSVVARIIEEVEVRIQELQQ